MDRKLLPAHAWMCSVVKRIFFLCAFFMSGSVSAYDLNSKLCPVTMKGFIDGKYPVTFSFPSAAEIFSPDETEAFLYGDYVYDKYGKLISLEGRKSSGTTLTLKEEGASFELIVGKEGVSGTWSDGVKVLPVSLEISDTVYTGKTEGGLAFTDRIAVENDGFKRTLEVNGIVIDIYSMGSWGCRDAEIKGNFFNIKSNRVNGLDLTGFFYFIEYRPWGLLPTSGGVVFHPDGSYLRLNGSEGSRSGMFDYNLINCEVSFEEEFIVETCVKQSVKPEHPGREDSHIFGKEDEIVSRYYVSLQGINLSSVTYRNRSIHAEAEQYFQTVSDTPWSLGKLD